jgi:hypothetical protein
LWIEEAELEACGVEPFCGLGDQVFRNDLLLDGIGEVLKPGAQMLQERSVPASREMAAACIMSGAL